MALTIGCRTSHLSKYRLDSPEETVRNLAGAIEGYASLSPLSRNRMSTARLEFCQDANLVGSR